MIDNVFSILMEQKLVDWEVIRQGLTDVPGLPDVLSSGSVAILSTARLELVEPTSPFLTQIVAMATEPHLSTRELLTMVDQICAKTAINQLHGRRCWRFGILAELLTDPEEGPIYGSIRVDEFLLTWNDIDLGSPLPGFPTTAPSEYTSAEVYLRRLEQLRDWLHAERAVLQMIRKEFWLSKIA